MILARSVFQAKWGKSEEVVAGFKEMAEAMKRIGGSDRRARILTDLSGPFHTVIQEFEVESLAEWERMRAEMFASPEFQQRQASGEPPFVGGHMEFWTIEATYGE